MPGNNDSNEVIDSSLKHHQLSSMDPCHHDTHVRTKDQGKLSEQDWMSEVWC